MEFRVLGPLQVIADGRAVTISSPRQRALLALLLVHVGRVVSSDRILDDLWPDEQPTSGREAVAFHVSRLRRALAGGLADGPIETRDGGYVLCAAADAIDAVRFERLAAEGHASLADDPAGAADRLTSALSTWRGDAFQGLDDFGFAADEARRLEELRLRATEDRHEADLTLGRHAAVVAELEALVEREPLRERLRELLMVALYRCGRQADALRTYNDGRRALADELGIDPSRELVALEAAILRQDPLLSSGPPLAAIEDRTRESGRGPRRNPYKGLRAFDEADAADFFGREALTDRLLGRFAEVGRAGGMLAVVGPSGSGKSSVVRAGLVPALRRGAIHGSDGWAIVTMFPGGRPFDELGAALPGLPDADRLAADPVALGAGLAAILEPDEHLVLVIDQFEELYTMVAADDERDAFERALAVALETLAGRLVAVVTLRADHLDAPLRSPSIGPLLRSGTELVPPLDRAELERAIERPALSAALGLEPGLVDTVVADVVGRQTMLPLLQYALTELVERASDRLLTRVGYAAIGGVLGALAGRAEAIFDALDPDGRDAARQVFLHLAAVEPTGEASGRRVARAVFAAGALEEEVVERFGRARLVTFGRDARTGRPTVEIAHEALLTHWPRLAGWIEAERESIWLRRRLDEAADEWLEHDSAEDFLLTGGRLEMFTSWASTTDLHLAGAGPALLEASLAARRRADEAERAREANERRLERRGTRWLQALVAVFALAAVLATGLLAIVWRQSESAAEARAIGIARELAVASIGRLEADPGLALLLALESARATIDRGWITEESMDALHWAIQANRVPYPNEDAPAVVRQAHDGPRGVYLLPAAELVRVAQDAAWWRSLSQEECQTYLHVGSCPPKDPIRTGGTLGVLTADGVTDLEQPLAPGTAGASVRVWSQLPVDATELLAPFAARTGTSVVAFGDDATTDRLERIADADVAILARPGDVAELTRPGFVVDLRGLLRPDEIAGISAAPLADIGWVGSRTFGPTADGARLVGSPIALTGSSLLWYPADAFADAGYAAPTTRIELDRLLERMIADGRTPWCMGLAGGGAAVDWVEDLAIDGLGGVPPSASGSPWLQLDQPVTAGAFLRFHDLVTRQGSVLGGPGSATRTPSELSALQMGSGSEPRCWLVHATALERAAWGDDVRDDLQPLRLPIGDAPATMRGRVYTLVVLRDRPEVRALVRELLGADSATALSRLGRVTDVLPLGPSGEAAWKTSDGAIGTSLVAAVRADRLWVDGSDLMPRRLGEEVLGAALVRVAGEPRQTAGGLIDDELAALAELAQVASP